MKKILLLILIAGCLQAAAQNVGIGNSSPIEKLEVTGNIKADSYKYTAPKTLYYAVSDGAFTSRTSTETVQKSFGNGGAYITNGTSYGLVAPVHLPHNARLTSVTVDFYDASATQDLIFYFVQQYSSGYNFGATINSSGSDGLNTQTMAISPPLLINNSNTAYEIFVAPASGNWATQDLAIRRVMLEYTLAEAQ